MEAKKRKFFRQSAWSECLPTYEAVAIHIESCKEQVVFYFCRDGLDVATLALVRLDVHLLIVSLVLTLSKVTKVVFLNLFYCTLAM